MSYGKTVTIRLNKDEPTVYADFKQVVIDKQHSDVCYVLTMLMKAYTSAVNNNPNPDDPVTMTFLKQNVQINMGCTFQYYTKKARRTPQDETSIITDKHNLLPEVTNQYQNLSKEAREFWLKEFQEEGIIPPTVSTPTLKTKFIKKLKGLWSIVRQLFS
jgi:hypothetical protein